MKIIFDHQIFSQQAYGGISRYFYELSKKLIDSGNSVEIRAPLYVSKLFQQNDINRPQGIYIPKIPRTAGLMKSINNFLSSFSIRNTNNVEVYHETYFTKADNCPKSAARIVTVYDMIHERFPESLKPGDRISDIKKFSLNRSDHIISISNNTREDLIDFFNIRPEKISVVHLGYMHREIIRPHIIKLPKPYLLYVGDRGGYKNFSGLITAYANSAPLRDELNLICFGGGKFKMDELNLISHLGLEKSKVMQQSGDDDLLGYIYANATAFVYPSLYEGFGIPPLEAMSYGCPVVCSETSSIPEVVGDASEFFDPHSIDSISNAIENVVYNDPKRQELIKKGYGQAKLFSWGKCAADTLNVYKEVVSYVS